MRYAVYKTNSGEIMAIMSGPANAAEAQCREGEMFFELAKDEDVRDDTHYIANGQLLAKTEPPCDLSVTGARAVLSGVPEGVTVRINDHRLVADGGDITVNFDAPGTYTASLSAVPYLDRTIRIDIDG